MSGNVEYKHFSEDEGRIYDQALAQIRSGIAQGIKFDAACEFLKVSDPELRDIIIDDALKVHIAEMHYGAGLPLSEVAKALGLPMERLLRANAEMMEDVIETVTEIERREGGGPGPLTH